MPKFISSEQIGNLLISIGNNIVSGQYFSSYIHIIETSINIPNNLVKDISLDDNDRLSKFLNTLNIYKDVKNVNMTIYINQYSDSDSWVFKLDDGKWVVINSPIEY